MESHSTRKGSDKPRVAIRHNNRCTRSHRPLPVRGVLLERRPTSRFVGGERRELAKQPVGPHTAPLSLSPPLSPSLSTRLLTHSSHQTLGNPGRRNDILMRAAGM